MQVLDQQGAAKSPLISSPVLQGPLALFHSKHYHSSQLNPAVLQEHSAYEYQASVSDKTPCMTLNQVGVVGGGLYNLAVVFPLHVLKKKRIIPAAML